MILNFKNLPYKTKLLNFHDVDREMRSIGAPAVGRSADGRSIYTLPVIVVPARQRSPSRILSKVEDIAEYLEVEFPARPVFPQGTKALQTLYVHYLMNVFAKPLLPIMIPSSAELLPESSRAHFFGQQGPPRTHMTREDTEQIWAALKQNFDFLAGVIDKNGTTEAMGDGGRGVFVSGQYPTYADFVLCSLLVWIKTVSPNNAWSIIKRWNEGRWERLLRDLNDYIR